MPLELTPSNRFTGCLIGLAIGDMIGLPFEFWSDVDAALYLSEHELKPLSFELEGEVYPIGYYSDDTAQMICLAESLLEKGFDPQDQLRRYRSWFLDGYASATGVCFGIGHHTLDILTTQEEAPLELDHDDSAGGNGALMRCAPIALFTYPDLERIKDYSIRSCLVTHNNFQATQCCVVLNTAIALILGRVRKEGLLQDVLSSLEGYLSPSLAKILEGLNNPPENYGINLVERGGYCVDTLQIALWGFLTTNSFRECMHRVIRLGGDADTNAAIAGALAGALYGIKGIPGEWKNVLINYGWINRLSINLCARVDTKS